MAQLKPPVVSVVTPTWQRHDMLLDRCIPSVAAQTFLMVEHVVVSDGPDEELGKLLRAKTRGTRLYFHDSMAGLPFRYACLPDHDPGVRWGVRARLLGLSMAKGDLICYLDDDNTFRPQHVERLVSALEANPEAGFAYSQIQFDSALIGADPPVFGGIDTSAIMHRRSALEVASWRDEGQQTIDWDIVERWIAGGLSWVRVQEVTADYYRSPPAGGITVAMSGRVDE